MTKRTSEDAERAQGTGGEALGNVRQAHVNSEAPARWPSVGQVIGENLRRLRSERALTQEEAARTVREVGLPWTRKHVAALETAVREDLTIGELVLLARAFDVPLREWFVDPEAREVELIRGTRVRSRGVRQAGVRAAGLYAMFASDPDTSAGPPRTPEPGGSSGGLRSPVSGREVRLVGQANSLVGPLMRGDEVLFTLAELKAAERLGWDPDRVRDMAMRLWGTTLNAERDRRVGTTSDGGSSRLGARRGHVTRALIEELRQAAARLFRVRFQAGSYSEPGEYAADVEFERSLGLRSGQQDAGPR
jgi:transcriptional regulator with XRE-family HTH domain